MNKIDEIKILNRKAVFVFLVYFIMGFVSVTFFVWVFVRQEPGSFDGKTHLQEDINIINPLGNESDPQNSTNPAYKFWYAPENSFGIQQTKSVNWSWFWKVFRKNSMWQLEAWHPVQEVWISEWQGTNLNEWLNITRVRNETNSSEKITLNVTNMHPTQDLYFRFKFGIDIKVKQYINKSSNYEYTITYPANSTENYTVFFNFSDVKPLIQNGVLLQKHGVKNDLFYFMLTQNKSRNPLGSGKSFEIDPTFGYSGAGGGTAGSVENTLRGSAATPGSNGNADNITCSLSVTTASKKFKCMLYRNDTKALVATSEERIIPVQGYELEVFTITATITSGLEYVITTWCNATDGLGVVERIDTGYSIQDSHTYNSPPNPLVPIGDVGNPRTYLIYCSYTETPSETWQEINSSINGTCTNTTTWQMIDYSINGSCSNVTAWQLIDYSINGSCTNTTAWQMIDYSINGTCTNTTLMQMIDYSINGTCTNTSAEAWTMIDYSINGTCTNTTVPWNMINSSINGTCTNTTEVFITITSPFPDDEEGSAPLQPTVYATINSTSGLTMNVSWYWGTTSGNENTLIGTDVNFTNSTQIELFFEANTRITTYYWRAQANDGTHYQNETYSFTTEGYPIAPRPTNTGLMTLGILFGSFGLIALLMIEKKQRGKRYEKNKEENIYYYERDTEDY